MNEEPKVVYKYRHWNNDCNKDVLRRNNIWLSSPKGFEDILDCKISICFDMLDTIEKKIAYSIKKVRERFHEIYLEEQNFKKEVEKVFCNLIRNKDKIQTIHNEIEFESLCSRSGVLSLCISWEEILMWDKYADNGKGYCVGFYEEKLRTDVLNGGGGKVIYDDFIRIDPMKDNDYEIMYTRLHYKTKKWEFEKEHRLIKFWPDIISDEDRTITIPDDYFAEIILGLNIEKETEKEIIDIALNKSIKVYKIIQKPFDYRLDRIEIC